MAPDYHMQRLDAAHQGVTESAVEEAVNHAAEEQCRREAREAG